MERSAGRHGIDAYRLRFSGTGGEYFRVWIVNILLTIVTLGLYTPWARRRTARYFYDHTEVAGSPLEFTAPLRKMVFGFLMFALLYVAFNIASETGQDTAVALFILAAALLAPFIWGSAMRFRLSSTRWRGLQLHFSASWREVYLASWPIFALAVVWIAIIFGLHALAPDLAAPPSSAQAPGAPAFPVLPRINAAMGGLFALGLVLSVLCIIRIEYNYKSLLVRRGGLGQQAGRWKPVYSDFVRIWLTTVGVFIGGVVLVLLIAVGLVLGAQVLLTPAKGMGSLMFLLVFVGVLAIMLGLVIATAPARAYREARMFQLIWNNIGLSHVARFRSDLQPWAYVRLRLKNLLLTVVTLGFYRAFARVSEYRLKVDSVTLHVKGGMDQLVGQLAKQQGGLGDALADAAGLDLIG